MGNDAFKDKNTDISEKEENLNRRRYDNPNPNRKFESYKRPIYQSPSEYQIYENPYASPIETHYQQEYENASSPLVSINPISPTSPSRRIMHRDPYPQFSPSRYEPVDTRMVPMRSPGRQQRLIDGNLLPKERLISPSSRYQNPHIAMPRPPLSLSVRSRPLIDYPVPPSTSNYANPMKSPLRRTGNPIITQKTYKGIEGMARKTIIEEPFEIEQPPRVETIQEIVQRPITIPKPPQTKIFEEIIEEPVFVQPPPKTHVIREIIETPVTIPQPRERRMVRERVKIPIHIQPPSETRIIQDVVTKKVLVDQPPKQVIFRSEYDDPLVYYEDPNNLEVKHGNPLYYDPYLNQRNLYSYHPRGVYADPNSEYTENEKRFVEKAPNEEFPIVNEKDRIIENNESRRNRIATYEDAKILSSKVISKRLLSPKSNEELNQKVKVYKEQKDSKEEDAIV